jgi:hypothetical protein
MDVGRRMPDTRVRARTPQPWLRSVSEKHSRDVDRPISVTDVLIILIVIAAVVAAAFWFLTIASGGIGPGTV